MDFSLKDNEELVCSYEGSSSKKFVVSCGAIYESLVSTSGL
jgi:hypothetical protein